MATSEEFSTEENKELLLSRVNDIVFVDALAGFECRRCERTLIRHYVAHCGHYFCANCKRVLTRSKSNCPLPACKQPLGDIDFQDVEFERKLYKLRAHCPNKTYGCPFVSQLKDLGGHLRMCKDTRDEALPVQIQGNNAIEAILRDLSTKFDKLSVEVNEIKRETAKSLKDMEIKVDNRMKDIETHMEKNKRDFDKKTAKVFMKLNDYETNATRVNKNKPNVETRVENEFEDPETEKKNLDKRANEEVVEEEVNVEEKIDLLNHIEEINKKMSEMIKNLDEKANKTEVDDQKGDIIEVSRKVRIANKETTEQINKMMRQLEFIKQETEIKLNLENFILLKNPQMTCMSLVDKDKGKFFEPDFTWKMTGLKDKMKEWTFELKSPSFKWSGYPGVHAQAQIEVCEDGQSYASLTLNKKNKARNPSADYNIMQLLPAVYYVLRNQSGSKEPQHKARVQAYLFTTPFAPSLTYETPLVHKSWLTHPSFNVDDSLLMDIYVEGAQRAYSYDGTLCWAIDNYRKRKRAEKESSVLFQEGPYFYTGPNGYRVRVRVCLVNGLALHVRFETGAFDAQGPFPHRTTVTVFNRREPTRNIVRTVVKDIQYKQEYSMDMCKEEDMENVVAESDTIFYKVVIKPSN